MCRGRKWGVVDGFCEYHNRRGIVPGMIFMFVGFGKWRRLLRRPVTFSCTNRAKRPAPHDKGAKTLSRFSDLRFRTCTKQRGHTIETPYHPLAPAAAGGAHLLRRSPGAHHHAQCPVLVRGCQGDHQPARPARFGPPGRLRVPAMGVGAEKDQMKSKPE